MSEELNTAYPDIARLGGLARALRAAAAERGVELTPALAEEAGTWSAVLKSARGTCHVNVAAGRRLFLVEILRSRPRAAWASGASEELDAIVGVVIAWLAGASAAEVAADFAFVKAGDLADLVDEESLIAAQWRSLLVDPRYLSDRPLLQAAHQNEHAHRLFPMLSHGALRLSSDLGLVGPREIRVVPLRAGGNRIEDKNGQVLAVLDTLDDVRSWSGFAADPEELG